MPYQGFAIGAGSRRFPNNRCCVNQMRSMTVSTSSEVDIVVPKEGTVMHAQRRMLILAGLATVGLAARGLLSQARLPAPAPTSKADVGRWDADLVKRAATILASPTQWNRADTGECPGGAKTFSISCALQKAVEESAGVWRDLRGARTNTPLTRADCRFHQAGDGQEGSCGPLFDEVPIVTISRAEAIKSGRWREDAEPSELWAGTTTDAEYPVMEEATKAVGVVTVKKYATPLSDYNNDPTTTFANVQAFFRVLQDQLLKHGTSDLAENFDAVEIEIYASGAGVVRTYAGWFPVSRFSMLDSTLRFQMDPAQEIRPNSLDREILHHADAIIASDAVWNRADNRKCPSTATTWSIYCAEQRASIEVTGGFHHRRPALELVRKIVDERTQQKTYQHRLMGYNNDPSTRLEDVRSLFAEAIARIK